MVLQPLQVRVCSGSRSLEASSCVAQMEAEIAQLKEALRQRQQMGVGTGLLARGIAMTPQRASTLAADNADDKNTGIANPRLRVVKDEP
jgi:hypothetical protein